MIHSCQELQPMNLISSLRTCLRASGKSRSKVSLLIQIMIQKMIWLIADWMPKSQMKKTSSCLCSMN